MVLSFPRMREPSQINKLNSCLRGKDDFFSASLTIQPAIQIGLDRFGRIPHQHINDRKMLDELVMAGGVSYPALTSENSAYRE